MADLLPDPQLVDAINTSAGTLGVNPADLAMSIGYETNGTWSPSIMGGKGGNYQGLIQFGPAERKQYGITPDMSAVDQMPAVTQFLQDRGVKPGMGPLDIYSTINAGRPGLYNASDGYGTVAQHVQRMQTRFGPMMQSIFGGGGVLPQQDNSTMPSNGLLNIPGALSPSSLAQQPPPGSPGVPPPPTGTDLGSSNPLWMMLMGLGGGIASGSGQGWGPGIGAGIQNAMNYLNLQRQYALKAAELGQTVRGNDIKQQQANQQSPTFGLGRPMINIQQAPGPENRMPPGVSLVPSGQPSAPGAPMPTPQIPTPTSSAATPPTDPNYRNYKVLDDNPDQAALIRLIGDGKIPLPSISGRFGQINKPLVDLAAKYNPNLTSAMQPTSAAEEKDATSGPQGDQLNALRTTGLHMSKLTDDFLLWRAKGFDKSDQSFGNIRNTAANAYATSVGGPDTLERQKLLQDINTELNAVGREATKVYAPGGGTADDVENWRKSINLNGPVSGNLDAVRTLSGMLQDKKKEIITQYKSANQGKEPSFQVDSPESRAAFQRMDNLNAPPAPKDPRMRVPGKIYMGATGPVAWDGAGFVGL